MQQQKMVMPCLTKVKPEMAICNHCKHPEISEARSKARQDFQTKNEQISSLDFYQSFVSYQIVSPLLNSMKLVGIFHNRNFQDPDGTLAGNILKRSSCSSKLNVCFSQYYAWLITGIFWLNCLRIPFLFTTSDKVGSHLFMKICVATWFCHCAFSCSVHLKSCHQLSGLPAFLKHFDQISRETPIKAMPVRRKVIFCAALTWICVIANTAFGAYALMFSNIMDAWFEPIPIGRLGTTARILYIVLFFYLTCLWLFSVLYDCVLIMLLLYEFNSLHKHIEKYIKMKEFQHKVEMFRLKHHSLCDLAVELDGILSVYKASSLLSGIVCVCAVLYTIIWEAVKFENNLVMFMYVFWMLSCSVILLLSITPAATLHALVCMLYHVFLTLICL